MKKILQHRIVPVVLAALCLGACRSQTDNTANAALEFPQTNWEMNAEQVMDAWDVTPEEAQSQTSAGRATSFTVTDREVFGTPAAQVTFSFINLKLGEAEDLQEFDAGALAGQEVLAGVQVRYPAGTDMDTVVAALDEQYSGASLTELTQYPLFSALDTGTAQPLEASETQKLWGSAPIADWLADGDTNYYRTNWPVYRTALAADVDWATFARQGRMVTIVCEQTDDGLSVRFDAYDLAVYHELTARQTA